MLAKHFLSFKESNESSFWIFVLRQEQNKQKEIYIKYIVVKL